MSMQLLGIELTLNCTRCKEPGVTIFINDQTEELTLGKVCPSCFIRGIEEVIIRAEIESGEYSRNRSK